MLLASGTQLGRYRIVSFVGAGGMGEVYRASDPRLNRTVAIKILAASDRAGADRVRRFEQEARAAAALNHPNILAVYDVGTFEDAPYIVSELIDGETLRRSLSGGALPVRKAIDYALQVAHGLAAAHAAGIVHRDLKPENLLVTPDGRIKILDFGLAKLLSPALAGASGSAVTLLPEDTEPGLLLGTVAYMAPEQVRGQPADARTDLFALGAIFCEMVTGRRAFGRGTPADTMTAILSADPPDLTALDVHLAPALDRIVRHALEKSPEQRFQSARDMAFALEALSDPSGTAAISLAPMASRRRPVPGWLLFPALAVGGVLAWAAQTLVPHPAPRVPYYQQVTFRKGSILSARFAGNTLVYGAEWTGSPFNVYSIQPGSVESRPLDLAGADLLSVSSSGDLAVSLHRTHTEAFTFAGTLARVPLGGSGPRELLDNVQEADWSPDGSNLAILHEVGGRARLEYPIGTVLFETAGWLGNIRVSPDGDRVAFIDHKFRRDDAGSVDVVDRRGRVTVLAPGWLSAQGLAWSGNEVWFTASKEGSNRALYAVTLGGVVRSLASSPGLVTVRDVSRDGRALITRDTSRLDIQVQLPDAPGERSLSWLDWSRLRDLSADGRLVLFDETGQGGGAHEGVYIRDVDGSPAVRLGDGTAEGLSPNGKWAISLTVDRSRIVLLPTGPGESRPVARGPLDRVHRAYWFPDGQHLLIGANEAGRAARLYVQDLAGGLPRPITPEGISIDAAVSPDGQLVAARGTDLRVTLFPVSGGLPRVVNGVNANELIARWSPDGKALYVYDPIHLPVDLVLVDIATSARETVKTIAASDAAALYGLQYLFLTPDLREYAYATIHQDSELYLVDGLK